MILIPAGALGPDLPAQNLELLPQQQILIRGRRRNATQAVDQTHVSAERLADANGTGSATISDQRLYVVELADAAVIYADGLQLACRATAAA